MRYINKKFWSLTQGVPKETKRGYNKVPIKTTKDNKEKKNFSQSPNKQGDDATTYDNQMESTHFYIHICFSINFLLSILTVLYPKF